MIPFSYAVLDHDGEIIRKHRWSIKEAKWFKDNNPNVTLIKLEKQIKTKENLFALVGECLF
jgi:hypothetical protein